MKISRNNSRSDSKINYTKNQLDEKIGLTCFYNEAFFPMITMEFLLLRYLEILPTVYIMYITNS